MPCSPSDSSLNPIVPPGIPLPGIGIPLAPIQTPLPNFDLPEELVGDLIGLIQSIQALFPSGTFRANFDFNMKSVLDVISSILSQIAPFLSLYNFFLAALRMFICIIEVLCALPNPVSVAFKLKQLFQECLPPFLNLFPWFALIAMILSLLLLIIALITYLIQTIIAIIEEYLQNFRDLSDALERQDEQAVLAISQKLASLLCFIENLMAVLIAIAAIISIIQSLASFAGSGICSDEDGGGCCAPEICPDFLKLNNEIEVSSGQLQYLSEFNIDVSGISGVPAGLADSIGALRSERWQIYADTTGDLYPISSIITPTEAGNFGGTEKFYPEAEYSATTPPNKAPYTVDITVELDPQTFGHSTDTEGTRTFQIKDCIAIRVPRLSLFNWQNTPVQNSLTENGVFDIEGGLVYEEDGETPFLVNGKQGTLNTFITLPATSGVMLPTTDDSVTLSNVSFVWKPIHTTLAANNIISVGCIPEISSERAVQNSIITTEGFSAIIDRLQDAPDGEEVPSTGVFPNILGATECVTNAVAELRSKYWLHKF